MSSNGIVDNTPPLPNWAIVIILVLFVSNHTLAIVRVAIIINWINLLLLSWLLLYPSLLYLPLLISPIIVIPINHYF
jgi:hypothetical protein